MMFNVPKSRAEAEAISYGGNSFRASKKYDPTRCAYEVDNSYNNWPSYAQCSKKPTCGPDGIFCKIHDPEYIAEKNRKRDEKYKADWNKRMIELGGKKFYEALVEIRDGHNDPRTLAREVLQPYEGTDK
jgi:hypothetical protein